MERLIIVLFLLGSLVSCGDQQFPPATVISNFVSNWKLERIEIINNNSGNTVSDVTYDTTEYYITETSISYNMLEAGAPDLSGSYEIKPLNNHFYYFILNSTQVQYNINQLDEEDMVLEQIIIDNSGGNNINRSKFYYFSDLGI